MHRGRLFEKSLIRRFSNIRRVTQCPFCHHHIVVNASSSLMTSSGLCCIPHPYLVHICPCYISIGHTPLSLNWLSPCIYIVHDSTIVCMCFVCFTLSFCVCVCCVFSVLSCMALGDLLVGQQAGDVASHLPSLWELCLRARDDIKVNIIHTTIATKADTYQ